MRVWGILFGVTAALLAAGARAQTTIDVTKITCSQFLFDTIAPSRSIAVWLSGYYNGLQHNTVVDLDRMDQNIDKIEDFCRLHLQTTLVDAAKSVLNVGK
jgi:acid stress chaperone HdeB